MMLAIFSIASLFFRIQLGRKRLLFLLAVVLLPTLASLWWRMYEAGQPLDFIEQLTTGALLQLMALGLSLWLGVSAVRDEIEDRTIVYLLVRPVRRSWVLGGKMLAAAALVALALAAAGGLALLVAGVGQENFSSGELTACLGRYLPGLTLAGLVYTGLFSLFGVLFEKPFIPAVIFATGWEAAVTNLPLGLSRFTVMYYLKSFLGIQPRPTGLLSVLLPSEGPADFLTSLVVLLSTGLVVFMLSFWLAGRREWTL